MCSEIMPWIPVSLFSCGDRATQTGPLDTGIRTVSRLDTNTARALKTKHQAQ